MKLHFQPTTTDTTGTTQGTDTTAVRRPTSPLTRAERDRRSRAELGRFGAGRRPLGTSWLRSSATDSWWSSSI